MALSVVFMGTPDFSVPALDALLAAGHDLVAVYSQPPRPAGRGMKERRSPVHERAEQAGLAVHTPKNLNPVEIQEQVRDHGADVAVVVAYGLILPPPVLAAPRHGCLNIHASLLPRWRGAAPINRAIMAGDEETGVAIMQMEAGLDTGPVALCERLAIGPNETAGELHDRLALLGAELIARALRDLEIGGLRFTPQDEHGVTYARKIDKAETRIDWTQPAMRVHDHIRGLSPFPGAWCEMPFGEQMDRVKVLRSEIATGNGTPGTVVDKPLTVACGEGAVRLVTLQRAGKQALESADFLRGHAVAPGMVLE